jgi:pimeloyl-ACP methyl ester carboxylesterase
MLSYQNYSFAAPYTVVLVHGFAESKSVWANLAENLAKNFRVLCPDLSGFGQSPPLQNTSIENMAVALRDCLDSLQIGPIVLIGHSLGGYVSLAFAELFPERLKGLGLFHSTAFADSEEKKEGREKSMALIREQGKEVFLNGMIPNLFAAENRQNQAFVIEKLLQEAYGISAEVLIDTLAAMRDRKDRIGLVEELNVPILYLIGKQDNAVNLASSLEQCFRPKEAVVHLLEGVGHMGMFEAPTETALAVENFVRYCWR